MAYQESDRVNFRRFCGFSATFLQADPRLESAITATQSIADGGARPDSSTEVYAKSLVTSLLSIEAKLAALWDYGEVTKAEEANLDVFRGLIMLRAEGRRLVGQLCDVFGMKGPRADAFGVRPVTLGDPFVRS